MMLRIMFDHKLYRTGAEIADTIEENDRIFECLQVDHVGEFKSQNKAAIADPFDFLILTFALV